MASAHAAEDKPFYSIPLVERDRRSSSNNEQRIKQCGWSVFELTPSYNPLSYSNIGLPVTTSSRQHAQACKTVIFTRHNGRICWFFFFWIFLVRGCFSPRRASWLEHCHVQQRILLHLKGFKFTSAKSVP